jgi:hypothetical protein
VGLIGICRQDVVSSVSCLSVSLYCRIGLMWRCGFHGNCGVMWGRQFVEPAKYRMSKGSVLSILYSGFSFAYFHAEMLMVARVQVVLESKSRCSASNACCLHHSRAFIHFQPCHFTSGNQYLNPLRIAGRAGPSEIFHLAAILSKFSQQPFCALHHSTHKLSPGQHIICISVGYLTQVRIWKNLCQGKE